MTFSPKSTEPTSQPREGSVEYWARRKPDVRALSDEHISLTWGEFDQQANALAEGLAEAGVKAGDVIAVRTLTRAEWVVIQTAIGKLGCVLLGLNWRQTPAELEYMLSNSGAAAFICDDADPTALSPTLDKCGVKVRVSIESRLDEWLRYGDLVKGRATAQFTAGDTPLIIYTSGTTGRPKGVLMGGLPGASLPTPEQVEYSRSIMAAMPKGESDVALINMPFSHGSAPAQVRRAIQTGGRLVMRRSFDPVDLLRTIAEEGVTAWVGVPTMLNRLSMLSRDVVEQFDLRSLHSIQVGGAPTNSVTRNWVTKTLGEILHEGYGSTETGMLTHLLPQDLRKKPGSCGRAFDHVRIEIRDEHGAPVATGDVGEIWVKTPVIIRQYHNGPPLADDTLDAGGYFRTGDVGYLDADGFLFITDRLKDMIVSGGVNVYPAEIEQAIHRHPAVQDVAVVGVPHADFGEVGKAFIELKVGAKVAADEIIDICKQHLAGYKIPKTVEFVEELPRNAMGKILKRELRSPHWKHAERQV